MPLAKAAPVGTDVRFHAKVPILPFLRLMHRRITRFLLVLRRGRRRDDRRVDDRSALEQQPLLLQKIADLGKDLLGKRRIDSMSYKDSCAWSSETLNQFYRK
jgi:hypothetical protein